MADPEKDLYELLEEVHDRDSFLKFLQTLIADREIAEQMERDDPEKFRWVGPNGWENGAISTYLESASCYFLNSPMCPHRDSATAPLTWRDLAEFLYFGKIYE
jgi:hypothetical protein